MLKAQSQGLCCLPQKLGSFKDSELFGAFYIFQKKKTKTELKL